MKKLFIILIAIITLTIAVYATSDDYTIENPECTVIAMSTGNRCENHQWGECPQVLCYVHCK
jgi:hypothetical protein